MSINMLNSSKRPVIIDGPVFYDDKTRTSNTIRLKRRIVEEFPELRDEKHIFYRAELYKTYDDFRKRAEEITAEKQGIPILLFLYK